MQEQQQQPTPFEFNAFQQWEIAFVYAFSCFFNSQQTEIAPSFYKLPEFTPQVDIRSRSSAVSSSDKQNIEFRRRDSERRERPCT
jgi:hypothetical protein